MSRTIPLAILAVLSGALLAEPQTVEPQAVRIEDADTLAVELAGERLRVQLSDIDAPESTHNPKLLRDQERTGLSAETLLELGRAADAGIERLLGELAPYRLHFDPQARDRYGRVPGDLLDASGRALSTLLVEGGYAVPLQGQSTERRAELAAALARAREERRGLWGSHPEDFAAWAALADADPPH